MTFKEFEVSMGAPKSVPVWYRKVVAYVVICVFIPFDGLLYGVTGRKR